MTRDQRQKQSLNAWAVQGYQGCLQAVTGFGKTRITIMAIKGLTKKNLIKTTIVTVPTITLKEQWEQEINTFKLKGVEVFVNNTAAMRASELSADLLVCDEVHTIPTDTRGIILDIPHKYFLGLSATIKRSDGKHEEILDRYPVFDVVTFEECLENGWISPYTVYNIPVDLSDEDRKLYDKADRSFRYAASQIGGYGPDTLRLAQTWIKSPDKKEQGLAAMYYNALRRRKDICINNQNKVEIVEKVVSLFSDRYGIIFSQSVDFADSIRESIGETAVTFHSKLTKKTQREILNDFTEKQSGIKTISTVQALDAGFDFPELSLAVVAAGYSSQLTNIQRIGRTVRAQEDKEAIIINLYSRDTQEERWLQNRQKGTTPIYLNSIHDLISIYEVSSRVQAPVGD